MVFVEILPVAWCKYRELPDIIIASQDLPITYIYCMNVAPETANTSAIRWIFGIVIPFLWIAGLFFPAYSDGTPGIMCFAMGWTMIFTGNLFAFAAWFSNLPFWISYFLVMFSRRSGALNASMVLAAVALMFSFGALTVTEVMQNEAGFVRAVHPSVSVYIWLAANVGLVLGVTVIRKRHAA